MRVLIVDDEQPARDRLRQLLNDIDGFDVVAEAGNGADALAQAVAVRPDIVLLDIRMPGMNGIETAQHLNALDRSPAVVFTTAYDEYAIKAFEARAIGYVLKPVRRSRLEAALQHASRLAAGMLGEISAEPELYTRRAHVCAQVHGELRVIPIEEIVCFRADQKYVAVYHEGGKDLIDESLKSLETAFADTFVRIHRGALVAVDRIERLEKTADGKMQIVLRDDSQDELKELIISRRHVSDVRKRLKAL